MNRYLFRLYFSSDASEYTTPQEFEQPRDGQRWWSDYVIKSEMSLLIEDANRIASWLVTADRFMTARDLVFQRVVVFELVAGQKFGLDTQTYTLIPTAVDWEEFGLPEMAGGRLRGLRGIAQDGSTFRGVLSHYAQLSVAVNRSQGRKWTKWFPASCGHDDVAGTGDRRGRVGAERSAATVWRKDGSGWDYCFYWYCWALGQVPELDFSVDVDRWGGWNVVGEALPGVYRHTLTHWNTMQRWHENKTPAARYLDELWRDVEKFITDALRAHGSPTASFVRQTAVRMTGDDQFMACASLWERFAALLGLTAPTGVLRGVPQFYQYQYYASYYGEHPYLPNFDQSLHPPTYPSGTAPEVPGGLKVTKNRAVIVQLVQRLYDLHQWYWYSFNTDYYAHTQRFFLYDENGTPYRNVVAPIFAPYPTGEEVRIDLLERYNADVTAQQYRDEGYQANVVPSYYAGAWCVVVLGLVFDESYDYERAQTLINYNRFEDLENWAFEIIDCLNLLQALLQPEQARPRLTLKEMELPVPQLPAVPTALYTSLPSRIEVVPYELVHRTKRPLWLYRPAGYTPPNHAYVQMPQGKKRRTRSVAAPAKQSPGQQLWNDVRGAYEWFQDLKSDADKAIHRYDPFDLSDIKNKSYKKVDWWVDQIKAAQNADEDRVQNPYQPFI